ncbi:MAG TPA: SRPBCC domain-containing protein [Pyrinomonadaceae bacterium]|nr:SRPBCC domain-containing protein [Pyrinomonadaceae bacterium]
MERSIWIDAVVEEVWLAVTDPDRLGEWYAPGSPWKIPELKIGRIIEFHHSPNAHHSGSEVTVLKATIEAVDPHKMFSLRWEPDSSHPTVVLVTSFELLEENGGTRVTISESGYENVPANDRQSWRESTSTGYAMSMENLKALLEGSEIPHR